MAHRLRYLIPLLFVAFLAGCARNANGVLRPALPWTRQVPNSTAPPANPWGTSSDPRLSTSPPALSNLSPDAQRWGFLNDLMKRADQQESLAESQRRELERLQTVQQDQYTRQRQYVIEQREKERAALAKQYADKTKQLADREKQYRGQFDQLQDRASDLDVNNRDLHAQLARSEQRRSVLEDELDLLKRRLTDTTQELTATRNVSKETGRQLQALQASARNRGNASIRANSSVDRAVTAVIVPGMDIRQDGDLVRISVPTEKLFMTGTASLHQGSQSYMDQMSDILSRYYPQQIAGIEAHTDDSVLAASGSQWRNSHQLTAAQSMAVFEQLTSRRISPKQLFVLGHGGNHPIVSGGTPEGQAANRRIEIVVYPETFGGR